MGWNFDNFDFRDPNEPESKSGGISAFMVGAFMGAVTLVVIAALILTTVGFFFLPDDDNGSSSTSTGRRQPRSDVIEVTPRPSGYEPVALQMATPTALPPEIVDEADAEYLLLTNIYERVNPSVVNIEIVSGAYSSLDIIDSSGSGFVLDMDGHIVTNSHVVRDAEEILVTFSTGHVLEAEVVGFDDYSDLAVIRVDPDKVPLFPVTMGDSNELRVGQRVIAIGNPFGLDGSMTTGIVSALGRSLPSARLLDTSYQQYNNPSIIQIDAAVNPGNSGGPLLDSYGRVIGINTAIRTENGGFQGIAFAVPVNTIKRIVPQLIASGSAEYPWLGISTATGLPGLSVAALADELDFPVHNGVLVSEVIEDSPAERAGLQAGTRAGEVEVRGVLIPTDADIVVAINGTMVRDIDDLVAYLVENTSPGDTAVLTIWRDGQMLDIDIELGVRP
jgi:S1-C subfamily serine protease